LKEKLNTLEEVHERVVARDDILCRLRVLNVTHTGDKGSDKELTVRRRPIPANIIFAGENG
jgi:hypothetical protein